MERERRKEDRSGRKIQEIAKGRSKGRKRRGKEGRKDKKDNDELWKNQKEIYNGLKKLTGLDRIIKHCRHGRVKREIIAKRKEGKREWWN